MYNNSNAEKTANAITPAMQVKLDKAREQIRSGQCVELKGHEDIKNYFASL